MRLTDALEGYLIAGHAENKAAKTLEMAEWHVGKFTAWLSNYLKGDQLSLSDVTPQVIRQFLLEEAGRGLAAHSVHAHYKIISSFLRWCIREDLIQGDPLKNVKPPRLPELLPKILSTAQVESLLKSARRQNTLSGRRNYLIVLTFLTCGLRANELCQLKLDDVHLESQFLIVRYGKGGKQRVVPLRPVLIKQMWHYLRRWRKDFNPSASNVFLAMRGLPLVSENVERICRRLLAKLSITGGTHILRHTFATLCIQSRLYDLERLRLILGHSDLSTTQRYLHLSMYDILSHSGEPTPLEQLGL